jgi:predicted nucleic acid-binding protein
MIVVDSNVVIYLYLPTAFTVPAEKLRVTDPQWVVPGLWRSEVRSALSHCMRQRMITLEQACRIQTAAENLLADAEYDIPSFEILQLVSASTCSAYDCEFVALAKRLGIKLVTADKKVLREFPETAISLATAAAG